MQGPARLTYGSRFSGGYQFPRTDSAQLERLPAMRVEKLAGGAFAQIVPLTGGRRTLYDVCGQWTARGAGGEAVNVSSSYIATDQLEAAAEFQKLIRQIAQEQRVGIR